jgi:hypothetical protein
MATINKYDLVRSHIDDIRQNLRETSDDSNITDEQIYKALIDARAFILERRLKKGKQLPNYMYQEICMPLCLDTYHDCDCIPDEYECKVLKTKNEIPSGLVNRRIAIFNVPSNKLRAVKIRGIFEDPATASAITICPEDQPNCVDITMTGFGTETSDNIPMYELVLKKLLKTKEMPEDKSNNADSSIPGKQI